MNRFCILDTFSIFETIEFINNNKERAVLVCDDKQHVIGVVSQGDIIRALVEGVNIYQNVKSIMKIDFYYLNIRDMSNAYSIFKEKKITILPIVDSYFNLIDIITNKDIYDYLENKNNID